MVNSSLTCEAPSTIKNKSWPYIEYYVGEKDQEGRKNGYGRNHWSGAESLECYEGSFLHHTMHGIGEYRFRHRGPDNLAVTHEGHFYNSCMHGYGVMSYADGRVFSGIYHNNLRYGPGIESYASLCENVGLWMGTQLVRLAWKPSTHSVVPEILSSSAGHAIAAQNRSVLFTKTKTIGEVNPALELLKQHGAPPLAAAEKWVKLYPQNCTDPKSQLYHADVFDHAFYDGKIDTLELFNTEVEEEKKGSDGSESTVIPEMTRFYSWNNNEMIIDMMRHCYQHEKQRSPTRIHLEELLNGPRPAFKPPAQHELDCRTVLMASYLGHIDCVAPLVNEKCVNANIADMQGNSAVMYAACGHHPDIVHFLVEAGARVDDCNDACCTPLGVALVYYTCIYWDIPLNKMVGAILPPLSTPAVDIESTISDWKIERGSLSPGLKKVMSNKTVRNTHGVIAKKAKSISSLSSFKMNKLNIIKESKLDMKIQDDEFHTPEKEQYLRTVTDYNTLVNDLFSYVNGPSLVPYLFQINDLIAEIDILYSSEDTKKITDKKDNIKATSKVIKDTNKLSKEMFSLSFEKRLSLDSREKMKHEQLQQIMLTIQQLLLDRADPRRVCCPQPALYFAIISYSPELVKELVKNGADVNEVYPRVRTESRVIIPSLGYSPIDIAVSGELTNENLEVIRILLESGANPDHTLPLDESVTENKNEHNSSDPTLLHAILSKNASDNEDKEDIRQQILDLLLEYGCDPIAQYKGRSAVDIAMSKHLDIFDIFIESPKTDLNAIINDLNQTILVKMFHFPYCRTITVAERIQTLTNLLLFGADPLLKCQNGDEMYDNLFVYMNKAMSEIEKAKPTTTTVKQDPKKAKSDTKSKKPEKPKAVGQSTSKSAGRIVGGDDIGDFRQTMNLMNNCARILYIRWIQAQLMKELIQLVEKYKHRHWNMILKEYKNGECSSLWLNPVRCLEIWDVLKTTKKRIYNDKKLLKYVLCIVTCYLKQKPVILREPKVTFLEKTSIESEVAFFIRDHNRLGLVPQVLKRPYVTPELIPTDEVAKFNICFECALPLSDAKIPCGLCKLVSFCSFECMALNIERINCHPCSDYLKQTYFPTPEPSASIRDTEDITESA